MIITQTPFRMSFFGGGTDLPQFYEEHGGAVISTTFDKYCYVNVRHLPRFFDYSTELSYSKIERVTDVNDIVHPAVREAMKYLDMREIRLTYEADLPARSGLGTSSSFAVGMLNAFYALKGKYADKRKLAEDAIYLERVLCQEAGGLQDQIAAAYGGFNRIDFKGDGWDVRPLILSPDRKKALNRKLLLFFTGFSRFSADLHGFHRRPLREGHQGRRSGREAARRGRRRIPPVLCGGGEPAGGPEGAGGPAVRALRIRERRHQGHLLRPRELGTARFHSLTSVKPARRPCGLYVIFSSAAPGSRFSR